ncbi:MAG: cytidyltransferase [Bacillota bacterium]
MKINQKLHEYLEIQGRKEKIDDLKKDRSISVISLIEIIHDFLNEFEHKDTMEWIRTIYDYALYKSFPHKESERINMDHFLLYDEVLSLLRYVNGDSHLDYDVRDAADEFYRFRDAYNKLFIYEIMQLDMVINGYNTIDHVLGVKDVAMHIAIQLKDLELPLDLGIVLGASLGHDVGKYGVLPEEQKRVPYLHYYYTEQWFKQLKLDKIGHIATNHSTWDLELETLPLESLVLIYADFRVKNRLIDGECKMYTYDLDESFQVILDKLDDVDEAKEIRYKRVYSKLKDFEDYMESMGIDTTLNGVLEKREKKYWSLLRGEDIVDSFKYKAIENNIYLMTNLMNQEKFMEILEEARGETNWRILRLYIEILKEYSTYLTQKQKILVLSFLTDLLLHKEEDVRKESAELIGKLLANYDEEYRKELPASIARKKPEETSVVVFKEILDSLLRPSHKITDSQNLWLYNLKLIVKSLFENCSPDSYGEYFDAMNYFFGRSDELIPISQFYLVQTINYLPINDLDSDRREQFYAYILKMVSSDMSNIRLSALDRAFEVMSKINDEKLNSPIRDYLGVRPAKSPIPAENYLKYILANKLSMDNGTIRNFRENYIQDQANISELFLENLKTATGWTTKKINIDILYDQVRKNPKETGIHTAIHLCNVLKVSAVERVRNYSGYTLLNIIPMLSLEQRNDVAIELLRALEMENYQFTKFIPKYLGHLFLYLPPQELDEVIDDLEEKIKIARPQTIMLLLNTIGVTIINYPKYTDLFQEDERINKKRLNRLLGLLLVPIASYNVEIKTEALRVIATTVFNSDKLSLYEKQIVFRRVGKKILTLIEDSRENNFVFYNNAASLNHIYRFISDYEFEYGTLDVTTGEDVVFFPGSFDPFSLGHREIAKEIRRRGFEVYLAVDEFSWSKRTEAHQFRRNIINMSIAKEDGIYLFPKEIPINLKSDSDMINLKDFFGDREVYVAVGSDVILNASAYKENREIRNFSHVIFDRRTDNFKTGDSDAAKEAISKIKGNVIQLTLPTQYEDISSTQIRDNIDKNRDISRLIDPMAADYIYNYGLYIREPLYKTLVETKTLDVEVHRNLNSEILIYLLDNFGSKIIEEGILDLRNKLSYRIIILKDMETGLPLGFSAFYWVRQSMLYDEFMDQELTEYVRTNAKGRTAFIACLYARDDDDYIMDMVLNETLSIALNRDYNYALYSNTMISGENKKAEEYLLMQGFSETPFKHNGSTMLMVDMNNPISIILDLENILKAPYDSDPRIQKVITSTRKRLKRALADLYPNELLISFNRDMVYSKLIQKLCDENNVSILDDRKKTLGEKMCVPFGIILNNSIIPNTVTKTLHTERIFAPDIHSFTVGEFPNYLSLEGQCKTIKSFEKPVMLLDDLLHKGYRLKIVEPLLRKEGIEITKLFVGILSGKGKEIAQIRNLDVDYAYFVPNLRLWFNESSQYPFLGGDMVRKDYLESNLIPSINFILPYVSPRFIKNVTLDAVYNLSEISLNNTLDLLRVIEEVYQEKNEKNLTLASLGEVIFTPRYPDLERSVFQKRHQKPSTFLEMDLHYMKRLEHTFRGHAR